jgi:hypothetical protein
MLQGHVSSKDAHEMMMLMVMPCSNDAQMQGKHLGCYICSFCVGDVAFFFFHIIVI